MRILLTAAFLAASALSAFAQAGPVDRWGGFKEGSWIKAKNSYEGGGRKAQEEIKQTLAESHPDESVLTHQLNGRDGVTIRFRRDLLSAVAGPDCVLVERKDLADQEILIASKPLKCQVRELRWKLSKEAEIIDSLKLWESDQVPGRVAKIEGTLHDFGAPKDGGWKYSGQITSLDAKVSIAGKELPCALLELSASGPGTWTSQAWMNDSVPGRVARSIGIREAQGQKESMEWRILDFEARK
jgi:hypothetical protein